jgi:hypothetical protein
MNGKQLLEVMSDLESRIAVIYERFGTKFKDLADVSGLWASMGREELHHADLLSRAAGAAEDTMVGTEIADCINKLQGVVGNCERDQARATGLQQALGMTADLEEAEAEYLHEVLKTLAGTAALANDPALQHRHRKQLEQAVRLFGTPALQRRVAWSRFRD